MTLLRVEGLETAYGDSQVLFGISLEVNKGEVVALLGRNGAGKTTTLSSIMGLVPPRKGAVYFKNQAIAIKPSRAEEKIQLRSVIAIGRLAFINR